MQNIAVEIVPLHSEKNDGNTDMTTNIYTDTTSITNTHVDTSSNTISNINSDNSTNNDPNLDNNANNNNNRNQKENYNIAELIHNKGQDANNVPNGNNVKNTSNTTTELPPLKPAYEILSKREKRLVYLALCLGMFLAALDQLIVAVSLPVIIRKIGGSEYLSWVLAAYLATASASMPLYGKYSDIYGRRVVFEFALTWFLAGSLICGFSPNITWLIAARAIQGIGGGGLMSLSMVLIGDIAKPAVRTKYMSSMSGIFGLATVLGPIIGGLFTDYVSWRWVFFINVPFVGITMLVVWRLLGKIKNAQKNLPVDILGSTFIIIAVAGIILIITWGGSTYAWSSYIMILLIILTTIFLAAFIYQEFVHPEPIVNLRLFKIRNIAVSSCVMFLFGMSLLGTFGFVPFYFQDVRGDSAIISGLKIVPMVLGVMICSAISGMYVTKTGKYIIFPTLGMGVFSIGVGLLMLMGTKTNYWLEALYLFIVGAGMGLSFPVYNSIVQNSVSQRDMAASIASLVFLRQMGGSIGVAILGTIYSQYTTKYTNRGYNIYAARSHALHRVFMVACIFGLLGFVIAFGIKNVQLFTRTAKVVQNSTNTDNNDKVNNDENEAVHMITAAMV
jgi:EmrB/QacA subfamily drug resistance transporter